MNWIKLKRNVLTIKFVSNVNVNRNDIDWRVFIHSRELLLPTSHEKSERILHNIRVCKILKEFSLFEARFEKLESRLELSSGGASSWVASGIERRRRSFQKMLRVQGTKMLAGKCVWSYITLYIQVYILLCVCIYTNAHTQP